MQQQRRLLSSSSYVSSTAAQDIFLPVGCWEEILSRLRLVLDDEKALEPISLVCKDFLSISNYLRRKLTFYVTDNDDSKVVGTMLPYLIGQRFPHLEEICLILGGASSKTSIDCAISQISYCASNLKKLKTLSLVFRYSVRKGVNPFGSLSRLKGSLSSLKNLNLSVCGIQDEHLELIGDCFPLLEELSISDPCRLSPFHVPHLKMTDAGVLQLSLKLRYLKKIRLYGIFSDHSLVVLVSNCPLLRVLAFEGVTRVTMSMIGYVLRNCPNLVSLSLPGFFSSGVIDFSYGANEPPPAIPSFTIENSIAYAKELRCLRLPHLRDGDSTLQSIASAKLPLKALSFGSGCCTLSGLTLLLQAYPSLSSLHIWDTESLTDESLGPLSTYLQSLTCITLSGDNLTNQSFVILVKNCPSLESIKMEHTSLGIGDFDTSIGKNAKIHNLEFSGTMHLNDRTLENIGRTCPNLRRLIIQRCHKLTPKGITKVLKTCDKVRMLGLFYYRNCKIVDAGSEALDLEELILQLSDIDDNGLADIGKMCHRLQKICLEDSCYISEAGVLDVVTRCKMLKEIDLKYCSKLQNTDIKLKIYSLRPLLRVSCSP